MSATVRIRQNRGKHKLLACVPCEKCGATLYPDSAELVRYRVREVSTSFMKAPAFYYSHAPSCPEIRRAGRETRISCEMHEYLVAHGARETELGHGNVRDYELGTLHGPARVTVVADGIGDPWLAVMFKDVERASAAMPHSVLLNRFSGKYNCHPIGLDGDTERILAAFRRHLAPLLLTAA